jgi:hypothetical protein
MGETECRRVLEEYFCKPFPNLRLPWLANPETGGWLELDCYNEELALAVEYNGYQHYHWPNAFHRTEQEFRQQLRRDEFKQRRCQEEGVHLISVPFTEPTDEIAAFIISRLPPHLKHPWPVAGY